MFYGLVLGSLDSIGIVLLIFRQFNYFANFEKATSVCRFF